MLEVPVLGHSLYKKSKLNHPPKKIFKGLLSKISIDKVIQNLGTISGIFRFFELKKVRTFLETLFSKNFELHLRITIN